MSQGSLAPRRASKKHLEREGTYDVAMAWLSRELKEFTRNFFTNWSESDLPLGRKLAVTARNRARALRHGCCGNHGQPGC
jgi:hypothetical protein